MTKKASGNLDRRNATTLMIEKKIDALRLILNSTNKDKFYIPTSMTKFRNWEDKELGLSKIGSPSSTNRKLAPHNTLLIDEAESLISVLLKHQRRSKRSPPKSLASQVVCKNTEISSLQSQVKVLTTQLIQAKHLVSTLQTDVQKFLERIESLEESNKSLRRELVNAHAQVLRVIKN